MTLVMPVASRELNSISLAARAAEDFACKTSTPNKII